eukprot:1140010-Pelagomonas_calceolata.AAC.2
METPPELLMRTVPKAHIAINLHQNRVTYNLKQAQISLAETSLMANPLCFSRFKRSDMTTLTFSAALTGSAPTPPSFLINCIAIGGAGEGAEGAREWDVRSLAKP